MKKTIFVFTTAYAPFVGGAEIAVEEVSRRLRQSHDIFIVTGRFRRDLPRREVRPEGTIIRFGFGARFDKWLLPFFIFTRHRLVHSASVLWGMDLSQGSLAAAVIKFFHPRTPFVLTIQYGESEERILRGRLGCIGRAFRFMLRRADYLAAESTYLFDLARKYGYTGEAGVVPNGVDITQFTKHGARNTTDKKIIITTSRLVQKNGIDILIRAIAEVKKFIPDIRCHIVGDGPEKQRLAESVQRLGLEKNIIFFGNVPYEDVPKYLHEADVFVRPSRSEGMGNSFVEALAAGLPIVGTRAGGIPDIIEDGNTGLFTAVDDPNDLSEKIIRLLRDETLRRAIVENGRKMVEERFTWDGIAKKYQEIFYEVQPRQCCSVLIASPDSGGPATYVALLERELPQRGIRVTVAHFRDVLHFPKVVRHFFYFLRIIKRGRGVDSIFAQDPVSTGLPAFVAATVLRKRFILKVVGDYAWEQYCQRSVASLEFSIFNFQFPMLEEFQKKKSDFITELRRKIQQYVARSAEVVIVPSNYLKGIVSQWGVSKEKIQVIYNSSDVSDSEILKEEAREKLGLSGTVLVSAGRLVPWKGFEMLIDMMPEVVQRIPDAQLVIIGSGPLRTVLESRIADHKSWVQEKILLAGALPHEKTMEYMRAADMFVLNTGYEGLSHAILEAMAVGTPVITTNIGGNPELITNGENGLLVPYNNREALQKAIQLLYTHKEIRQRYIQNAKEKIKEFGTAKMVAATAALLQ